jgi:hypothetical protein
MTTFTIMQCVVMLSVVMLNATYKPFMLSVVMLNVTYKPFMMSVVILNVVMLSVVSPSKDKLVAVPTKIDKGGRD